MFVNKAHVRTGIITGGSGSLGRHLSRHFPGAKCPSHAEMDVTSRENIDAMVEQSQPEIVIHLAAITDVARCETDRKAAWETNVEGTRNLVEACQQHVPDCRFVLISTPCVFDGESGGYSESDIPCPANFYGLTKLLAEINVLSSSLARKLVLRTNFVERGRWRYPGAFVDRWGTYLFADEAAEAVRSAVDSEAEGILHLAGDKKMSMYELASLGTKGIQEMSYSEWSAGRKLKLTRDMSLVTRYPEWRRLRLVP